MAIPIPCDMQVRHRIQSAGSRAFPLSSPCTGHRSRVLSCISDHTGMTCLLAGLSSALQFSCNTRLSFSSTPWSTHSQCDQSKNKIVSMCQRMRSCPGIHRIFLIHRCIGALLSRRRGKSHHVGSRFYRQGHRRRLEKDRIGLSLEGRRGELLILAPFKLI